MRGTRIRKWLLRSLVLLLVPPFGFVGWNLATDNFAIVEEGRLYRSGQMDANALTDAVRKHNIKSVLNLRGSHPDEPWYRDEKKAVLGAGATQIDIAMSSCEWMSRAQMRTLIQTLDTCERPVLIHCWRGAERTGLASACAELLQPGSTLEQAEAQFSLRYLFVRAGDGKLTIEHLDQYEAWLRKSGLPHTPDHFRLWANEEFEPGTPGREQWPYDPFPLVVITRPDANAKAVAAKTEPGEEGARR